VSISIMHATADRSVQVLRRGDRHAGSDGAAERLAIMKDIPAGRALYFALSMTRPWSAMPSAAAPGIWPLQSRTRDSITKT
jgi:hypothetical protein